MFDECVDEKLTENEGDVWILFAIAANAQMQAAHDGGSDIADGKGSPLTARRALSSAVGLIHGLEHLDRFVVEDASGGGEVHAATGALQ